MGQTNRLGSVSEATAWHSQCRTPAQRQDSPLCSLLQSWLRQRTGSGAGDSQEVFSNTLISDISPAPGTQAAWFLVQAGWVPAAALERSDLQWQGAWASPPGTTELWHRLGGGQLRPRSVHPTLVLRSWSAQPAWCAVAAPWADPHRALGCSRQPAASATSCSKAHPIRAGQDT